jgi:putative ABC transport system permease protein
MPSAGLKNFVRKRLSGNALAACAEDPTMSVANGANVGTPGTLRMASKLAYRNLFHDRLSLFVTLVGIVFSVVLIAVQCSIYLGSEYRIIAVMDHIEADLWVVPAGTKAFDLPTLLLPGREKYAALSTPGVRSAEDLIVSFVNWRREGRGTDKISCASVTGSCGSTSVLVVGFDTATNKSLPWDVIEGSTTDLNKPNAVAVDSTYFGELAVGRIGDSAEINDTRVTVGAITRGIRSFTTLPFIFTALPLARTLAFATPDQGSYTMVRVAPGSSVEEVRKSLQSRLPDAEVLTHQGFRKRSLDYWLFETGAGSGLIAGAVLAIIVGIVVVSQTLYASTKEHINEFATLRALGASSGFIRKVILWQAVLSALMGYAMGMMLSQIANYFLRDFMPILTTFTLVWGLLVLTIGMCVFAAVSAIIKVVRIDPAAVFSR